MIQKYFAGYKRITAQIALMDIIICGGCRRRSISFRHNQLYSCARCMLTLSVHKQVGQIFKLDVTLQYEHLQNGTAEIPGF